MKLNINFGGAGVGKWRLYFFGLLVVSILILYFSIDGCNSNKKALGISYNMHLQDVAEIKEQTNKLGQVTATAQAYEFALKDFEKYVEENADLKQKLANKYSEVKTVYVTRTEIRIDSIKIPVHDTLPCDDFDHTYPVRERFYAFDLRLKNKNGSLPDFNILNLSIPDTATTIIGIKKSGFLNLKRTLVAEQIHSNKYLNVQSMNTMVKAEAKPKTLRKIGVGILVGLAGGFYLFNK